MGNSCYYSHNTNALQEFYHFCFLLYFFHHPVFSEKRNEKLSFNQKQYKPANDNYFWSFILLQCPHLCFFVPVQLFCCVFVFIFLCYARCYWELLGLTYTQCIQDHCVHWCKRANILARNHFNCTKIKFRKRMTQERFNIQTYLACKIVKSGS